MTTAIQAFPRTPYTRLDEEHAQIHGALANLQSAVKRRQGVTECLAALYDVCQHHWVTEQHLFLHNSRRLPVSHMPVSDLWREHDAQHVEFLRRIRELQHTRGATIPSHMVDVLRQSVATHIREYDLRDFHYGQV